MTLFPGLTVEPKLVRKSSPPAVFDIALNLSLVLWLRRHRLMDAAALPACRRCCDDERARGSERLAEEDDRSPGKEGGAAIEQDYFRPAISFPLQGIPGVIS